MHKFNFDISDKPLYDVWQPDFESGDLVKVIMTPGIDCQDMWVVYGRFVDHEDPEKPEWYILRPGYQNKSGKNRIKVKVGQMERALK